MKWLPFFILLFFYSCKLSKKRALTEQELQAMDSMPGARVAMPIEDTSLQGFYEQNRRDSVAALRERDSFYAITPVRFFITDTKGDAFEKLVGSVIDTIPMSSKRELFTDTTMNDLNKDQLSVNVRHFYKSYQFTVKVLENDTDYTRRIFINGKELRPGKELDITLSGMFFINNIRFSPEEFRIMQFGDKPYLFMPGYVENCNGTACGVAYFLLYDPAVKKAMLVQQLRSDFIAGYDSKTRSPVFIDMADDGYKYRLDCFIVAGRCYRFDPSGRIRPLTDSKGKQYYFHGYYKGTDYDTIRILDCHL